jgi:hypothetical protein
MGAAGSTPARWRVRGKDVTQPCSMGVAPQSTSNAQKGRVGQLAHASTAVNSSGGPPDSSTCLWRVRRSVYAQLLTDVRTESPLVEPLGRVEQPPCIRQGLCLASAQEQRKDSREIRGRKASRIQQRTVRSPYRGRKSGELKESPSALTAKTASAEPDDIREYRHCNEWF